ncbi:hypothetical protein BN59_02592 [Legionella massiliensis]|uniref:Uncharacterized protein n=1 Tax=Legionella massiliensis TaxID=1034943 RepID=A0A078KYZ1_9GAMM|nr:hypothetical protein [Legionella massiliensis]CDZ78282.1 hypothetical protein BN59_02592 [Legionella massiliensis]CEE14020.1 hypothetical protein BN1094_02592 [Legionella massiliensis]
MSEEPERNELSSWLSTYGLITAERILETYKIKLQPEEVYGSIKNPESIYHRLLKIPLKNVFNGIILQQAHDYQVYAQKMFIDYLMSGENSKPEESPGGYTREELENVRRILVGMSDDFQNSEAHHLQFIADSQKELMKLALEWQKKFIDVVNEISSILKSRGFDKSKEVIRQVLNALLVYPEQLGLKGEVWARAEKVFGESLSSELRQVYIDQIKKLDGVDAEVDNFLVNYMGNANDIGGRMRQWRTDFYSIILRVTELINQLPEYHSDQAQLLENQEALHFDTNIGEKDKG